MNRIILNIAMICKRYFLVCATTFLVLLTSCAVKSSLKSLAGIPTKTEQGLPKAKPNFSVNTVEKCTVSSPSDMQIVQKSFLNANDLLPVIIFTAAFLFLLSFVPDKASSHPLYGNLKIPGTLPIFLRHRKLII